MNYKYLTRKQANIIYRAVKSDQITAPKKFISDMYNLVGSTDLSPEAYRLMCQVEDAIRYIFVSNFKFAQARIDGKRIVTKKVIWDVKMLTQEDVDNDYWFKEVGDIVTEWHTYDDIEED